MQEASDILGECVICSIHLYNLLFYRSYSFDHGPNERASYADIQGVS